MGEKFGRDPIWEGHLATEIHAAEISVDAVLFEREMSLGQVLDMQVGQTLVFDVGPRDPVTIKCGEISLTEGQMGRAGENISVRVDRPLRRPKMTLAAFEKAATKKEMQAQ
jgi:flagellar motor switch protein FliM